MRVAHQKEIQNIRQRSSTTQKQKMANSSLDHCNSTLKFQHTLYAVTYTVIFIPGLLANSIALWLLRGLINKKNKAIIFMINLAMADLSHVLSLPLRIYYYVNHTWPFGNFLCLLCFYLKYLNMYASIVFLTLISFQRYVFTTNPFKAKGWKRRYDVAICIGVWLVVGAACLPFPIYRSSGLSNTSTSCFADLGVKKMNTMTVIIMLIGAELSGFLIPLIIITYCTLKTRFELKNDSVRCDNLKEKHKALRMVVTCASVFFVCFTPYHIIFFFYVMVSSNIIHSCPVHKVIMDLHPFSLCLASINCCLNPILYYFTASEFQNELAKHSSSVVRVRLMSKESVTSIR
ncbi:putative P2Y purinoceptor 10 [Bufo bufo]|uniref:putative P2Y purinoceptor 10 n=1 Tax=Bufo bufo TaxID=8384 RepID=UPI001ABE69EB|nr:putative P2Y purinoceptor 10 [Bufo bufo]